MKSDDAAGLPGGDSRLPLQLGHLNLFFPDAAGLSRGVSRFELGCIVLPPPAAEEEKRFWGWAPCSCKRNDPQDKPAAFSDQRFRGSIEVRSMRSVLRV